MKLVAKIVIIIAMLLAGPLANGQTTPTPLPTTNAPTPLPTPALPAGFTNYFNNLSNSFGWGTNFWWTNTSSVSNAPHRGATNTLPGQVVAPGSSGLAKGPADLQTLIQQFQKQRNQLQNNLNSANDSQRQQILQQLEAIRQQIIQQLENNRADISDQLRGMGAMFNNSFGPINGGPSTSASGPGNGHGDGNGGGVHKH